MAKCGAKTRSGQPCKNHAMANGRCRMHGGKSTGAPKGNQNARTHGIYSDVIADDERELWAQIEIGSLDDAIRITHLQLRRALAAQSKALAGDGLDLDAVIDGNNDDRESLTTHRRRRPYEDIINRLLGRIGDLEAKRAEILSKAGQDDGLPEKISELIERLPS